MKRDRSDIALTTGGIEVRYVIWNSMAEHYMGQIKSRVLVERWNCAMWDVRGRFIGGKNPELDIKIN